MTQEPDRAPQPLTKRERMIADFSRISAEALTSVPATQAVSDDQIDDQKRKARQTHQFRDSFFRVVCTSVIGALAASIASVAAYCFSEWGQLDSTVIIGFNAAVVVQVIGLALIVAKYLFPEGGAD